MSDVVAELPVQNGDDNNQNEHSEDDDYRQTVQIARDSRELFLQTIIFEPRGFFLFCVAVAGTESTFSVQQSLRRILVVISLQEVRRGVRHTRHPGRGSTSLANECQN